MSNPFVKLSQKNLNSAVANFLCPKIETILDNRNPGHCMRITDLDDDIMESVCLALRKTRPNINLFILGDYEQENLPNRITSTKLIELRNPEVDGLLRPPLLVFIPASLRTSAEDSFSIATFEELSFTSIYEDLISTLMEQIPVTLTGGVRDLFNILTEENWRFADEPARVRYLLTAIDNGIDGETLGASLYEMTLIPDFKLFEDQSQLPGKIRCNLESVRKLMNSHRTVRGRIVELGLKDKMVEERLTSFFEKFDVQEPETWTVPIAIEKSWWSISFDKWTFKEEVSLERIRLKVLETDLPFIQENEQEQQLANLIGQQVLVPNERRKMNVLFEVNPHPTKVSGLDHFTAQIISQTDGPIGKSKKVKVWATNKAQCLVSLINLNKIEFEEGWHFVRILPWTADGDPIPLESDPDLEFSSSRIYESEPFYVLPGGSLIEEPPQRAIPSEKSLDHAWFRLQLTALNDNRNLDDIKLNSISWAEGEREKKNVRQAIMMARFGCDGTFQIPLSRILKTIEQRILSCPKHPFGWRMQINIDTAEPISEASLPLPSTTAMQSFLAAREELFSLVRQGKAELIMQGFSMVQNKSKCLAYVESYLDLVRSILKQAETSSGVERYRHLQNLRNVLAVDSVYVILTDYRGKHREAVLVAPTHPLRVIWLHSWVALGNSWLDELKTEGGKEYIATVRNTLLGNMQPSAFPVGVPVEDGRIFMPVDNINFFWGFYAPATEVDSRGLMAEICKALGISEPTYTGVDLSGQILADKIERYLSQHPYVHELSVNIFNPGSGAVVAEALIALQTKSEYIDLRYNVRLFTVESSAPYLGEAIDLLIRPETLGNEAVEAFSSSTGSPLFSKLKLAKYSMKEFHTNTQKYSAHISVLLDVFPAEELSIAEKPMGLVPFYGLIQGFETSYVDDDNGTFWYKWPVTGHSGYLNSQQSCYDLLSELAGDICLGISAVATSGANFKAVPVMTLGLSIAEREFIYEVHQISDWVFTIDRYLGIEFFDHGGQKNRPDYLIDYVPGTSSDCTHNLIISSRSTNELEAMIRPILKDRGLQVNEYQSARILAYLRSLSGQLALKLISSSNQQVEALGLALARLYLEYQNALSNQIIVPLDAHIDLYRELRDKENLNDFIGLQRTDLALFDLNLSERTIVCNLVEVKCFALVGDFSAYNQLKEHISVQINQSERVLQRHFDPLLKKPDRPDRLLKSLELAQILKFYLERSIRYEIFDTIAAQEANVFLQSIENGYSLQFRRSALIFDFEKSGTGFPETEVGIEYHRIGKDLIEALLDGCNETASEEDKDGTVRQSLSEQLIPEIPKLKTASFIAPKRERSTSWTITELNQDVYDKSLEYNVQTITPLQAAEELEVQVDDRSNYTNKEFDKAPSVGNTSEHNWEITTKTKNEPQKVLTKDDATVGLSEVKEEKHSLVSHDVILGINGTSPQYGLLGEVSGRKIALDLNHTHTISLFGVQGGGKSYTLGTVIEMASMQVENLNVLPNPLATVIFHYSPTQDYSPEFTSMINPNSMESEIKILHEHYKINPKALNDVIILTPLDKVEERRAEFPDINVYPIAFAASELKAAHWKFLMGAIGSQSMYMRQINLIMRGLRNNLTLDVIRNGIENSSLSDHLKELAQTRLKFANEYINDDQRLQDLIRPGRLIIVDLRDEYIEKDEALGLFVVMLQIFSEATYNGIAFNKLVVFDEAHKYIENDDLVSGLVEVVREMRHKGTSIMVASQDPPSVPISLIELSSQIIMHKFNSPAWLKHIQKANAALGELTSEKMSQLGTGEAYIWSSKASDESFTRGAVKIRCRPRVTQHGGETKTAVK